MMKMMSKIFQSALFLVLILITSSAFSKEAHMLLSSSAFKPNGTIPVIYSCDGDDISPQLAWQNLPPGAKSLVLILDDPDAPRGTFDHWIVYDIPPSMTGLEEHFPEGGEVKGVKQGKNDMGMLGYGGPCPPPGHGTHHYHVKLYALNIATLGLPPGATKKQVEARMEGHMLEKAEMVGLYSR